ncbi:MAG TPA: Gfo/Idh/MocA family oxidoreductase [Vicinamibacterales bacterium]
MGSATASRPRPRLGFLGLGWIGRHRLECVAAARTAEIAALADADRHALSDAQRLVPGAVCARSLEALLGRADQLDGLVIATPSAGHAPETAAALDAGLAVFCQKPLGRTAAEASRVVEIARQRNRLLDVDLGYRHLAATQAVRNSLEAGELGDIVAVDLTFHNAYGPDKPWYYDRTLSGGGCLIDLGVHLIDLLHVLTGRRAWRVTAAALFASGRRWTRDSEAVEDLAIAQLDHASGMAARLACSWRLPAGCDAVIEWTVQGTTSAARVRNVGGSFYDFTAERLDRGRLRTLVQPPDAWGGRALLDWTARLAEGNRFDPRADRLVDLAAAIDAIYDAATPSAGVGPPAGSRVVSA